MAKYTIELRTIVENSGGIEKFINQFFDNFILYDENRRAEILELLVKHYYFREIAYETVAQFKFRLNQKIKEVMPYYNQLWFSTQQEFNIFNTVDYTMDTTGSNNTAKTGTEENENTRTNTAEQHSNTTATNISTGTATSESENNGNTDYTKKFNDTPQSDIEDATASGYMTNYTLENTGTNGNTTTNNSSSTNENSTSTGNATTTGNETYTANRNFSDTQTGENKSVTRVHGKQGGKSNSELIMEYRQAILNIDLMFIKEFEKCFMGVW